MMNNNQDANAICLPKPNYLKTNNNGFGVKKTRQPNGET